VTDISIVASDATAQGKSLSCSIEFSNEQKNNVRLAVKGADPMVTNDIHAALDERVQATFAKNWGQLVAALTLMAMLVGVLVLLVNFGEPSPFYSALTSKDFAELNQMAEHANSEAAQLGFIFEMHRREIRAHVNRAAPMELTHWMTASVGATLILLIVVIALLAHLAFACYPRAVFNWGEYGEHFENLKLRRKYIRNLVIGGVILGLIVNVAAAGFSAPSRGRP
jgi:hypothetical protein